MKTYALYDFNLVSLAALMLSNPDEKVYTPMEEVRDQLKCLGADLTYWEAIADRNGGRIFCGEGKIRLSLPGDFKVDERIWIEQ